MLWDFLGRPMGAKEAFGDWINSSLDALLARASVGNAIYATVMLYFAS